MTHQIDDKHRALGGRDGLLGYPQTDETATPEPNPRGRFNHFQRGSIYWHPETGAHEIRGAIRQKWAELGWERSLLGFPVSDESPTPAPNPEGRFNHFQRGSIYWHPETGAHEVHGAIRELWAANGWERLRFGFPTSDETAMDANETGRFSRFQRGVVAWTPALGAWADYHGQDPEGRFEGELSLFERAGFQGRSLRVPLSTERPLVTPNVLRRAGLEDRVSALRLHQLPPHVSVYLFEHRDLSGRFVQVTGGERVEIEGLDGHLRNRLSSVVAVNHGLASVRLGEDALQAAAGSALDDFAVEGVRWSGGPEVRIEPSRRVRFQMRGTIAATWPDTDLDLRIYLRLMMTGPARLNARYDGYYAKFGGSFAGYANPTIKRILRRFFGDARNQQQIVSAVDRAMAQQLEPLASRTTEQLGIRRLNFLPGQLELVVADDRFPLLAALPGGSVDRPAGQVSQGSV